MAPSYIVKPAGGSDNPFNTSSVTTLKFNNFDHAYGSGILTVTPQTNIAAGDGISVSGSTITNAAPMCDIAVYGLGAGATIHGADITAL